MSWPTVNREERIAHQKGYRVTELGILLNPKGVVMNPRICNGYRRFRHAKHTREIAVHRLQAFQIYGEQIYTPGICVRHLDGNSLNNSASNIAIGTALENQMDKPAEVRRKAAVTASKAAQKHNHEEIIQLRNRGFSYAQIMDATGIRSLGTIHFIVSKSMEAKTVGGGR